MASQIGDGFTNVTTAGTRVLLSTGTYTDPAGPIAGVQITAKSTNTGTIVVGGTTTVVASAGTRRGTPLLANDSCFVPCDDIQDVGLDATVNGEGVTFTWIKEP